MYVDVGRCIKIISLFISYDGKGTHHREIRFNFLSWCPPRCLFLFSHLLSIRIPKRRAYPCSCVTGQKLKICTRWVKKRAQGEAWVYSLLLVAFIHNWESCLHSLLAGLTLYFYIQWQKVKCQRSPESRMPNIQHHSFPPNKCFHHQALQWDFSVQLGLINFALVANTE